MQQYDGLKTAQRRVLSRHPRFGGTANIGGSRGSVGCAGVPPPVGSSGRVRGRSSPEAESLLLHKQQIFAFPERYCGNTASIGLNYVMFTLHSYS